MEASKFIKESARMCHQYGYCCPNCPAYDCPACIIDATNLANKGKALEEYIAIVEKWSAEHPIKTNLSEFKDVFGDDITNVLKSYIAGTTSNKAFKDAFISWLGKEYTERRN